MSGLLNIGFIGFPQISSKVSALDERIPLPTGGKLNRKRVGNHLFAARI